MKNAFAYGCIALLIFSLAITAYWLVQAEKQLDSYEVSYAQY